MRLFFFCFLVLLSACNSSGNSKEKDTVTNANPEVITNGQVTAVVPVKLSADQIPASLRFRGKLNEAWQWKDKLGDNILITSFVDPVVDKQEGESGEEYMSAEVHAFHFVKDVAGYKLLWRISDAVRKCEFDITLEFLKGAIVVTDLDNDSLAETTIQYKMACRSDVSPSYMKLIMHEDTLKFSLRGSMWVAMGDNARFTLTENDLTPNKLLPENSDDEQVLQSSGRYESEKEFATAPAAFLQHARKQWIKYVKENFE